MTGAEVDYNGSPAGYTERPAGGHHLRRGARQRDALRCTRLQAPAGHLEKRPARAPTIVGLSTVAFGQGHAVLPCRHRAVAIEVARPEQLRLRRLVQPRSSGTRRTTTSASASRARTTTDRRGRSSGRSWPTPRSIRLQADIEWTNERVQGPAADPPFLGALPARYRGGDRAAADVRERVAPTRSQG